MVTYARAAVTVLWRCLQPQHHGLVFTRLLEFLNTDLQS